MKSALLVLCLLLSGCGSGSSYSTAPPPSLTGNWTFTAASAAFPGVVTTGAGQIVQTGNSFSGTLILTGSPCSSSGAFNGTLAGTALNATLDENGQAVTFVGTASSDLSSASGTYTAASGGCTNGDKGTWTGSRK